MAGYEWCVTTCACSGGDVRVWCWFYSAWILACPFSRCPCPQLAGLLQASSPEEASPAGASLEVAHRQVPLWKRPLRQEHPSGRRKKMGI